MEKKINRIKGRGAQSKPNNPFEKHSHEWDQDYLEYAQLEGEEIESGRTKFITVHPKTILTSNKSPDIPFKWSINP